MSDIEVDVDALTALRGRLMSATDELLALAAAAKRGGDELSTIIGRAADESVRASARAEVEQVRAVCDRNVVALARDYFRVAEEIRAQLVDIGQLDDPGDLVHKMALNVFVSDPNSNTGHRYVFAQAHRSLTALGVAGVLHHSFSRGYGYLREIARRIEGSLGVSDPVFNPKGVAKQARVSVGSTALHGHLSLAQIYTRIDGLDPGQVEIVAVNGGGSAVRYLVLIRGIDLLGSTPNNLLDATVGSLGDRSADTDVVKDALKKAKVRKGSQLMIVGHSQGGITAMDLADDPSFNGPSGEYRVTHVVTAGSPVGNKESVWVDPKAPTKLLELEHNSDFVPELDGKQDKSGRNSTVYRFGSADLPANAHGAKEYYVPELDRDRFTKNKQVRTYLSGAEEYLADGEVRRVKRFQGEYSLAP